VKIFSTELSKIRPTQLYISETKYRRCLALFEERGFDEYERLIENPLADLEIGFEQDGQKKTQICGDILWSLPEWFGIEEAIREYTEAAKELLFVKATLYGKVVGFVAVKVNYGINADLYVLGMYKEFHRNGIGTRMVDFINAYCRRNNIPFMSVKTLSERHPDKNHTNTRTFYEKSGFRSFEEFPTLWGEANPCLYMIKEVK
jgi:ribosomal protein S18 acetylase RimI-like enzyme